MNLLCQFHAHPVQHLVKSFQSHALLLVCRLLHPYAISKNRQAAISLLEVLGLTKRLSRLLRLAKRDLRVAPEYRKERKKARILFQTNSSMTDLSLHHTSDIILLTSLAPPLRNKQIRTELPNGFQKLHPMIFALMVSTMYLTSSSVTYGPAGRHIPTLKIASDTPLTYAALVSEVTTE